jgi:hypothetical protein
MVYTEESMQSAVADIRNGVFTSIRACAKAYGVPRSTLTDRLAHRDTLAITHQRQQRLTPEQEAFIVDWILIEDSAGCPPTHARVRDMAARVLAMNGDTAPLGKKWVSGFLQRNPRVASRIGRSIERARSAAANQEDVRAFLDLYNTTCKQLSIPPADTWNIDETGIAIGSCDNSRVITDLRKKKTYCQSSADREWVSAVEVISAASKTLKPVIIFRGKALHTTWFPTDVPDWVFTYPERGWTSNTIGFKWLKEVFIPEACHPGQ